MGAVPVTVDVLDHDETTAHADLALTATARNEYGLATNDAAAFSLTVPDLVDGVVELVVNKLVRFTVAEEGEDPAVDATVLIEGVEDVYLDKKPSSCQIVVKGRDWIAELDDAPVSPPMGIDSKPDVDDVVFDFRHPEFDFSVDGITPSNIGAVWTADLDPGGGVQPASPPGKDGLAPKAHTDAFACWYGPSAVDMDGSHPVGDCYVDYEFTLADDATVMFSGTADDTWIKCLDGGVTDGGVTPPAEMWPTNRGLGVECSAGIHVVRLKVTNTPYLAAGGAFNPLGWTLTIYTQSTTSTLLLNYNVIGRTGFTPGSSDPLLGGGWRCIPYPAQEPGFTVTHAFRILLEQAQADGYATGWTLGCTDTTFTGGGTAPLTSQLVARCDNSLLDVLKAWHDDGFCDFAARPDERVIDLWDFGARPGTARTITAAQLDHASRTVRR